MTMSPIEGIGSIGIAGNVPGLSPAGKSTPSAGAGFADLVKAALDQTSRVQNEATTLQNRFQMEDPDVGLEQTMIAMQKASIGFQAVVQARNKLVSAYTEIMNMSI
jgi:flagellar hook-basal body complex protein FliE